MTDFYARDGQFWLDGQPVIIQAGEFHYFRTPRTEWRHRLGLLKAAGFNALASYIPWIWHQLAEDESDLDGHSHPLRDLAGFLDLAAEMGFWIIARPGPYIMAETINEGIPPWVFSRYPQAAYISQDGQTQNVASYLQADFLACVKKWYRAVFEVLTPRQVTRGGRIILIQLDNEMGMIQWVRNILDINPDTLARFAGFVRQFYGEHLPRRYPTGQLEAVLREGITNPQAPQAAVSVQDYRRFYRAYLAEYTAFLWETAQANGMEVPPVINIHGFMNGGKTFPLGLSQLIEVMRLDGMLSATDVYPIFIGEGNYHQLLALNEITKALHNPHQPLFSIEFQAGGNNDFSGQQTSFYELHTRLSVSVGMRGINHYLFCDGENDPVLSPTKRHDWGHPVRKDGTLRRHYYRYPRLSRVLAAYGAALVTARPARVATIGFLLDQYMNEVNTPATKEDTSILIHQREVILFDFIARGLALTQRAFDALDLERSELSAAQTPLLWVMMEKQCPAAVQQKLVNYALSGGKLILAGRMCVEDADQAAYCTLLQEALGIERITSDRPFNQTHIHAFHYRDVPVSFLETYHGAFDEVFAQSEGGETVGFIKTIGQGKVMVLGAALGAYTLDDLDIMNQMALKMDCPSPFNLSDWADVRLSCGEKGNFLFVNNYLDDPVETTVAYQGEMLFRGKPLSLAARSGLILPLEWQVNAGLLVHSLTSEVVEITENESTLILKTAQDDLWVDMTLTGYRCENAAVLAVSGAAQRVLFHGEQGIILLTKLV